jgi:serine/threonine protein kinase
MTETRETRETTITNNTFFYDLDSVSEHEPVSKPNKKKQIHNIVKKTLLVTNEVEKTQRIKQILYWERHFYLFNTVENIRIAELSEDSREIWSAAYAANTPAKVSSNTVELLLSYDSRKLIYLDSYLKALSCSTKYITKIIEFYKSILKSAKLLEANGLSHNNINLDTILVNENDDILLTKFGFALDTMREKGIETINLPALVNYYTPEMDVFLPVEFHLLRYQLNNNLSCLSCYNIETVIKQFVANHSILKHFDSKTMLQDGLSYFMKYNNKSLIDNILIKTWDNYAISIVFLRILIGLHKSIKVNNKVNNKFIILFMKLLLGNINLDPSKRLSLDKTTKQFELLLNSLDINDFTQLLKHL